MKVPVRYKDQYNAVFGKDHYAELLNEVCEMESESAWKHKITTCELRVEEIGSQVELLALEKNYGIPYDVLFDTALDEGSSLLLWYDKTVLPLRDTAIPSLLDRAKVGGSSLTRMAPWRLAEVLNHCFSVSRGQSLILERSGKVTALHSDNAGGYEIMPVSALLNISENALKSRFGRAVFCEGLNSHEMTTCVWNIPDAQDDLVTAYQNMLSNTLPVIHAITFMPCVRFITSDTKRSCASLIPMFRLPSGATVRLCSGVQVKHERKGRVGLSAMEQFDREAGTLYAKFDESQEKLKLMANHEVRHPASFVIAACQRNGIPQKYGERVREEVSLYTQDRPCALLDIYLSMNEVVGYAKEAGAGLRQQNDLEEKVAKLLSQSREWANFDLPGLVWDSRKAGAVA